MEGYLEDRAGGRLEKGVVVDVKENDNVERREGLFSKKQDLFRKYILNQLNIKILSLLAAIIVWMVIVNIEDPFKEKRFTVTVETINEEALASVNKVYEIVEGDTAQVTVVGKKSIVDKLRASDIRATADLSNLSAVNAVAIVPELIKTVSSEPTLECDQVLKVSLEDMGSKQVKVNVVAQGTPEEGYTVGECISRPNMIEVTGGVSVINKIDSVKVSVNVNGASEDFTRRARPVACDADGKEVQSSTLRYGVQKVRATVHIVNTKTIPVQIDIKGTPAKGYEFVKAECLPEKIEIAGPPKVLSDLTEVTIPIDITGMKSSSGAIEQNISIQDYLPEGITVLSEYAQVSLRIEIERQMQRTLRVPVENIKFASLGDNLTAEIVGEETEIEAQIQGLASVLDSLSEDNYMAYVDCNGLQEGRYELEVQFNLSQSCTLLKTVKVMVRISRTSGGNDDTEESPVPEGDIPVSAMTGTAKPTDGREEE